MQESLLDERLKGAILRAGKELPSDVVSFYVQKTGHKIDIVIYEAMIDHRWKKGRMGAVYSNVLLLVIVGYILYGAVTEGSIEGQEFAATTMTIFIAVFFFLIAAGNLALRWFRKPTKNFYKLITPKLDVKDLYTAIDNLKSNVGKPD